MSVRFTTAPRIIGTTEGTLIFLESFYIFKYILNCVRHMKIYVWDTIHHSLRLDMLDLV